MMEMMYPFGETVRTLVQEDRTPKKVFVLGVYASAVHAMWINKGKVICRALAVASEPRIFWDGNEKEAEEITDELFESKADLLILLGNPPISQYLNRVTDVPFRTLREYADQYGYGTETNVIIRGKEFRLLPLTHPRQIGALGSHSGEWSRLHSRWEQSLK